jgi:hypothetical protein
MAVITSLDIAKRGGRISLDADEPKLREQFFGFTKFEFGDEPHGPVLVVQVVPPDLDFATHHHNTDYSTVILQGSLRVGRTWCRTGHIRVQDAGSTYGPIRSGPEGATVVSFYGDRSALPDQFTREADRLRYEELFPLALAACEAMNRDAGSVPVTNSAPESISP